ncbi:ABC transporter permease [Arthrobacter sp. NPDC080031]|uniref:ABC transporter permease n=1 Tax=Arthrobacter sp. NPDC080031 TaxID=3155918 RepID=UPI0034501E2F
MHVVVVLLVVSFVTMLLLDLSPGDPARIAAGDNASPEQLAAAREQLNLDQPMFVRWLLWLGGMLRGDFGTSLRTGQQVMTVIMERLPVTFEIAVLSLLLGLVIAIPLGTLCAYLANSTFDRVVQVVSSVLISTPSFLTALLFSFFLAVQVHLFPIGGWVSFTANPGQNLRYVALAVITLGLAEAVVFARLLRSDMLVVLRQEYILAATARGLRPIVILVRHALRPSSFSLVTLAGLSLGRLIGGTVTIEVIFSIPGIGQLLYQSILNKDIVTVQGAVAFIAVAYVLVNALVDLIYAKLDPRIGMGGKRR